MIQFNHLETNGFTSQSDSKHFEIDSKRFNKFNNPDYLQYFFGHKIGMENIIIEPLSIQVKFSMSPNFLS